MYFWHLSGRSSSLLLVSEAGRGHAGHKHTGCLVIISKSALWTKSSIVYGFSPLKWQSCINGRLKRFQVKLCKWGLKCKLTNCVSQVGKLESVSCRLWLDHLYWTRVYCHVTLHVDILWCQCWKNAFCSPYASRNALGLSDTMLERSGAWKRPFSSGCDLKGFGRVRWLPVESWKKPVCHLWWNGLNNICSVAPLSLLAGDLS